MNARITLIGLLVVLCSSASMIQSAPEIEKKACSAKGCSAKVDGKGGAKKHRGKGQKKKYRRKGLEAKDKKAQGLEAQYDATAKTHNE